MSQPTRRVFQALNGLEIMSLIDGEIRRALEQRPEFRRHLAYPQVAWRFVLEVDIYRPEYEQVKVEGGAEYVQESVLRSDGRVELPEGTEIEKIVIEGGENSAGDEGKAPDQLREEGGLDVLSPTLGGIGVVDKPVTRSVKLDRRGPVGLAGNPGALDADYSKRKADIEARGPVEQPNFGGARS